MTAATDGSYKNLQAQQGIDQVFLTMRFPDAFGDYGGLVWNIGSIPNRYGTAGKYDGGMYETYQFGRTHVSGETLTATFSNLDPMGDWTITLEHGLGAKLDFTPFTNNQTYQITDRRGYGFTGEPERRADLSNQNPDYLPWPGPCRRVRPFCTRAHTGQVPEELEFWPALPVHLDARRQLGPEELEVAQQRRLRCRARRARFRGASRCWGPEARSPAVSSATGTSPHPRRWAQCQRAGESLELLHVNGGPALKQGYFGRGYHPIRHLYGATERDRDSTTSACSYLQLRPVCAPLPRTGGGTGPTWWSPPSDVPMVDARRRRGPWAATQFEPGLEHEHQELSSARRVYTPLSWLGYGRSLRPREAGPWTNAYSRVS